MSHSVTKALQDDLLGDDRPLCPACVRNKLYAFWIVVYLGGYRRQHHGRAWVAVCKDERGEPGCGFSVKLDTVPE